VTDRLRLLVPIVALAVTPSAALAHAGAPPAPHDLWTAWTIDPLVLLGLTAVGWLYACGVSTLWQRAGVGRGMPWWRVAAFASGILFLVIALMSPLDALSTALFSAHMAQHQILMLIAAPLLVLGSPLLPLLWALPASWRIALLRWAGRPAPRAIRGGLTRPVVVLALYVTVTWAWHGPLLYQAALENAAIHALEHACLLGAALLFWWIVVQPQGPRRLGHAPAVLVVFVAALQGTALGALILFSGSAWYPTYAASARTWGLSPLADQQIAGAMMGAPAGMLYLATALALIAGIVRGAERDRQRAGTDLPRPALAPPAAALPGAHPSGGA
jgi:putative membrane protein